MDDKYRAVKEAHRVLKKGGNLVLIEPAPGSDYSKIVIEFLPENYPRINVIEDYEKPLKAVFGKITKNIPPFKVPYVFPDIKVVFQVFKFALEDWHKVKMSKEKERILLNEIKEYQRKEGKVVINEVVT